MGANRDATGRGAQLPRCFGGVTSGETGAGADELRLALASAGGLSASVPNNRGQHAIAARANRGPLLTLIAVCAVLAVCLIRLAGLVRANAVNLPFQDQWDLLRPLFAGEGPWAAFHWQHGPHRQGLGGMINWFLYRMTGWDVRAEAWAEVVVLTLAAVAAIVLAVRLRGRLHWSDTVFPLVLMSPIHWETMLLTPNLAHGILPVLLVFLLALAWTGERACSGVFWVILAGAVCLFTGFAFCAALASAGLAALLWFRPAGTTSSRWPAAVVLVVFAVVLAAFGWDYRWEPAVLGWHFPVTPWWDYPRFVAFMFSSLIGWRAIAPGPLVLGGAFLISVLLAFGWSGLELWHRRGLPLVRTVWLLTGTTLAYAAFTAVGRLPVNIEAAFMWRYLPLMTPAIAGLVLWSGMAAKPALRGWLAALWLGVGVLIWGNFTPERHAATIAAAKHRWIEAYLATRDLRAANQASDFFVYRGDPESPIIAERLRWLERNRLSFFR
jgi:hypothetical protein